MLRSLKYRIAITIFLLEAVMLSAVLWQTLSHAVENSRRQVAITEHNAVQLAGEISRIALFTDEYDTIQAYLEKLAERPSVLQVYLVDSRGIIVASHDFKRIGERLPELKSGDSSYWRTYVIENASGKLGALSVNFSSTQLDHIYKDALTLGAGISLAGMITIAIVGIVFGRLLTRRLNIIVTATENITKGDMDVRTNLSGTDEIALLGKRFDAMANRIAQDKIELEHANTELEKRVEARTQALKDANNEYESFAYSVSHDLRAPLRAMNAFGQMLMEDYGDKLDSEGVDYIKRINKNSVRMGLLIDDLLNLAKINRQNLKFETINLSAMCTDIKNELQSEYPDRHVEFDIQQKVTAVGDSTLVYDLLQNLIGNAWKFTRKNGNAKIEFKTREINGDRYFAITDNGVGFDPTYTDKLFKPFHRLHSDNEFEGTGIGLASVSRIIQRHNGEIWGESSPGKGAAFYFRLGDHQWDNRCSESY